jgi:serine protease DegQ
VRARGAARGAIVAVLAAVVLAACQSAGPAPSAGGGTVGGAASAPFATDRRGVLTLAPVVEPALDAVVNIAVRREVEAEPNPLLDDPEFRRFFGLPPPEEGPREVVSGGSGVIVDARRGLILTNAHVVEDALEIQVALKDRRRVSARLLGTDRATDLAVLRIPGDGLTALSFADSDAVRVGDYVIALGNPFGLSHSATSGIVSAVGRPGLRGYQQFIQTDASINPGNSGGPLIDSRGRMIGVNTAILSRTGSSVGVGFAVPANLAENALEQIVATGTVERGRIGVAVADVSPERAGRIGLSPAIGAEVQEVVDGSPADRAGLEAGDVITAVGGRPVDGARDLQVQIGLGRIGGSVTLTVVDEGGRRSVDVAIGERPAEG